LGQEESLVGFDRKGEKAPSLRTEDGLQGWPQAGPPLVREELGQHPEVRRVLERVVPRLQFPYIPFGSGFLAHPRPPRIGLDREGTTSVASSPRTDGSERSRCLRHRLRDRLAGSRCAR